MKKYGPYKSAGDTFVKKGTSVVLALFLLLTSFIVMAAPAEAAAKTEQNRAIAIVFDNSGSMYDDGDMAWCRATYAMEVFASMLNEGDTLMIYPMHRIEVNAQSYTSQNPFVITDSSQASMVREIYTRVPMGTPIESIDAAAEGLLATDADLKYMIVLTDGDIFYQYDQPMSSRQTLERLDERFEKYAGNGMNVMYLGIGRQVIMPSMENSEVFIKKQASDSKDVLSTLTEMCNLIFGRDSLPKDRITGNKIEFDIPMSKLIVFVQGENVADLNVTGNGKNVGTRESAASVRYGTAGAGGYYVAVDTSLQGMMVTYTDCPAGTYDISYSGTATSIEVYYEPDADLDFVFTDARGRAVDYNALYEGEYKVSFGLKDAKTGELLSSDLLGNPVYKGSYFINGQQFDFNHSGQSGEVYISLKEGETFNATLTVTYLSGYTITKNSEDFGWPDGGLRVGAKPAAELRVEITGGQEQYPLLELEQGEPYIASVYYAGELLEGEQLEAVELMWVPETSNAEIMQTFAGDHYELTLHYKDTENPSNTVCGDCTVTIFAFFTASGYDEAQAQADLTYRIEDVPHALKLELTTSEDYLVISELDGSATVTATLTKDGAALTPEECANILVTVDCGGINSTHIIDPANSTCVIYLEETPGLQEGDKQIKVSAVYTDPLGRAMEATDTLSITMGTIPLWMKWLLLLLLALLLLIIALIIMHIKVLPTKAHINKRDASLIFDGEDESKATTFIAKVDKGNMTVHSKYAGVKAGITMDVKPGKESFLRKPQMRRSAEIKSSSVRKYGNATILEASIGSIKYVLNEETNKLERVPKNDKPFVVKHGTTVSYSGTMNNAGIPKPFTVTSKLNFKKK